MDQRRAQLLELGMRLFGTRSYDEVSIDDIAQAANASKGLLYHYFGGKRAFYVAVVAHAAQGLMHALRPNDQLTGPARGLAGLDAYLRFVEERANTYTALVTGGLGADPEIAQILEATRQQVVDLLLNELGPAALRPAYRLAVRGWIGAVEATCVDWLASRALPRGQLLQLLLRCLQGALASAYAVDPVEGLPIPLPRLVDPATPDVPTDPPPSKPTEPTER